MSIDNQIEPPQSFLTLFMTPGRDRLTAPQSVVLDRYERCEDMACILAEQAQTIAFRENLSESEVLTRCHRGLLDDASVFREEEARWITCRLAELLGWQTSDFDPV